MTTLTRIAAGLAVFGLLVACQQGDPVSNAGGSLGGAALLSGSPSANTLPAGSASVTTSFGGFTAAVPDAFSRRNGAAGSATARRSQWYGAVLGNTWTWKPTETERNASPALFDPRRPLIQTTAAGTIPRHYDRGTYRGINLITPKDEGADYWELWFNAIENLTPDAPYTVVMVKYSLMVNGQLDQEEMILTGAVTQPDSLFIADGRPDSIPNASNWTGDAPGGCAPFPGTHTNPFIVSRREPADADGFLYPDKCWLSGNGIYAQADHDLQAKSMVGRSDDVGYGLPNYNYIEVWEGDFGTGRLVHRTQIAQDIDRSGKPINNTYPPFPRPTGLGTNPRLKLVDRQASFPISDAIKAQLNGAIGLPVSLSVTLTNLQTLGGGAVYKVWYVNPSTGAAVPASGNFVRVVANDTVESGSGTSTFTGGPGTIIFRDANYPATISPRTTTDSLRVILVSKEGSATTSSPGGSQPLWVGIFKVPPGTAGGTMTFGDFNSGQGSVRFVPQGRAEGGVVGDTVRIRDSLYFQGSVVNVRFSGLTRPPEGYVYRGYLVNKVSGELLSIGGLRGPGNESLDDADTAAPSNNLTASAIVYSKIVYDARSVSGDQLCDYNKFRLVLEPREGVQPPPPPTTIFNIDLPAKVHSLSVGCR